MSDHDCRACRGVSGEIVLDLGSQPACDYFPRVDSPGPDPVYPLRMWLCAACGLAQLPDDPTVPEEPRGAEPAALVAQASDAVGRVFAAGILSGGQRVAEYGSPHGGSWLGLLASRGLAPVSGGPADVVLDCFGLMHAADQAAAISERAERVAPGGVLLLQYHALGTIVRLGQWNALRHGHYAYYSAGALTSMLARCGFTPRLAWEFDLYGGTVLLAATRDGAAGPGGAAVTALLDAETGAGLDSPAAFGGLRAAVSDGARRLREWLSAQRTAGRTVLGYGAASRAVALLGIAGVTRDLLPAVVDASPAKHGLRMPGTDIPIAGPELLAQRRPDAVLLFVGDLLAEVRAAFPEVEAAGGRWVTADEHPRRLPAQMTPLA
jgi:hypothetical protein